MKKNSGNYGMVIIGLLLLVTGMALLKTITAPQGIMQTLPYVCIGLGCGLFGGGMGGILGNRALKRHPEISRQKEVEEQDERNRAIADRAKARASDIMIFVFGALMLSFGLMNVELRVILLMVLAYLFVAGYHIYHRCKLEKEM